MITLYGTMKPHSVGVDTVELWLNGQEIEHCGLSVKKHRGDIIQDMETGELGQKVVLKFGETMLGKDEPVTKSMALDGIKTYELANEGETEMKRCDIALNYYGNLRRQSEFKFYYMLVSLFAMETGGRASDLFNTNKNFFEKGNIKTSNKRKSLTVYNGVDKDREAPIRVEFRLDDFRNFKDHNYNITKSAKDVIYHLSTLINHWEKVEDKIVSVLWDAYTWQTQYGEIGKGNFTEFVVRNQELFLTYNILKRVKAMVGVKTSDKQWVQRYRAKRELPFITKTDMKKGIASMKRAIKPIIK